MFSKSYTPIDGDTEPIIYRSPRSQRSQNEEHELESRLHQPSVQDGDLTEENRLSSPAEPALGVRGPTNPVTTRPYRTFSSPYAIFQAVFDLCLLLAPLYFLVFGIIVSSHDKTPIIPGQESELLVQAARLGPTIFPIVFAAVVGRFLKTFAAWKIERGATVATLEQLLGSKTVLSALLQPFKLRLFNILTPLLILLWAISPIGGQSSQRVLSVGPITNSSTFNVSYFDTNSPYLSTRTMNGSLFSTISAVYTGALVSPQTLKSTPQDSFMNIKIPMIEYLEAPKRDNGNGNVQKAENTSFMPVTAYDQVAWSSLLGLPLVSVVGSPSNDTTSSPLPADANSTFNMESSYFNLGCDALVAQPYDQKDTSNAPWTRFRGSDYRDVQKITDDGWIHIGFQKHDSNSTGPRLIYFESLAGGGVTHVKCNITTTYVESQVQCLNATCAVTGIRRSLTPLMSSNLTIMDYTPEPEGFINNWLWSTPLTGSSTAPNPNNAYFTHPEAPFAIPDEGSFGPDIFHLNATTFSIRFSQLLNTNWLAGIANNAIARAFVPTDPLNPPWIEGHAIASPFYASRNANANFQRQHIVLFCHRGWLAVLILSSLIMLLAGVIAISLEIRRHGPDILDSFSSLVRDNPYIDGKAQSSMLDGSDLVREWGKRKVRLGDVAADADIGHVAVGLVAGKVSAQPLRRGRLYD